MGRRLPSARPSCLLLATLCVGAAAHAAIVTAAAAAASAPSPSPSAWATQCVACRNYVECDRAYHGRAGKFCFDNPASGAPCCCPRSARCLWYRFDGQCYCDEMILGTYTPLAVGLCGIGVLFTTLYKCMCSSDSSRDARSIRPVAERSRLLGRTDERGSDYGATRIHSGPGISADERSRDGD